MVLSNLPPTLDIFELYGQHFGGIKPHFKDYKFAAFDGMRSHLRGADALSCLMLLLATATLIAIAIAVAAQRETRIEFSRVTLHPILILRL